MAVAYGYGDTSLLRLNSANVNPDVGVGGVQMKDDTIARCRRLGAMPRRLPGVYPPLNGFIRRFEGLRRFMGDASTALSNPEAVPR